MAYPSRVRWVPPDQQEPGGGLTLRGRALNRAADQAARARPRKRARGGDVGALRCIHAVSAAVEVAVLAAKRSQSPLVERPAYEAVCPRARCIGHVAVPSPQHLSGPWRHGGEQVWGYACMRSGAAAAGRSGARRLLATACVVAVDSEPGGHAVSRILGGWGGRQGRPRCPASVVFHGGTRLADADSLGRRCRACSALGSGPVARRARPSAARAPAPGCGGRVAFCPDAPGWVFCAHCGRTTASVVALGAGFARLSAICSGTCSRPCGLAHIPPLWRRRQTGPASSAAAPRRGRRHVRVGRPFGGVRLRNRRAYSVRRAQRQKGFSGAGVIATLAFKLLAGSGAAHGAGARAGDCPCALWGE